MEPSFSSITGKGSALTELGLTALESKEIQLGGIHKKDLNHCLLVNT